MTTRHTADAGLIRNEEKVEKCFRVIWEGEYAGYVFAIIAYSLKDSPKFMEGTNMQTGAYKVALGLLED